MLAMAAPRPAATPSIARVALAAAFALSLWLGSHVHRAVARWHRDEAAPMLELARQVPAGARVACVGTDAEGPIMVRKVLTTNCPGMTQWVAGAYAGSAFAGDGNNAVRYRGGKRLAETGDWSRTPSSDWDFFLVRGKTSVSPKALSVVASARGRSEWTLYRVLR
jgi:hypothetical protein